MHETTSASTVRSDSAGTAPSDQADRLPVARQNTSEAPAHQQLASITPLEIHHGDVHKRQPSANWLRSASVDSSSTLAAQFIVRPYGERARLAELIEVQRQTGLLHSHKVLAVPRTEIFILEEISLTVTDGPLSSQPVPVRGTARTRATPELRGGRAHRAKHHVQIHTDAGLTATGSSAALYVPAKTYRRLQNRLRDDTAAVSQAPAATMRARLTIDTRDPILSDHQNDHISGMSVICAIESFFRDHAPQLELRSLHLRFDQPLNSSTPADIALRFPSATAFEGEIVQSSAPRARFTGNLTEQEADD